MKKNGLVQELFISVKGQGRRNQDNLELDENGVCSDKFYGKNPNRAILLTSNDSYLLAKENNIEAEYGSLGENILMDINPYSLKVGDRLSIGEVELEITHNCTICNSLAKVDPKLPKLLEHDRGVFAKTIKNGTIKKGDIVTLAL